MKQCDLNELFSGEMLVDMRKLADLMCDAHESDRLVAEMIKQALLDNAGE